MGHVGVSIGSKLLSINYCYSASVHCLTTFELDREHDVNVYKQKKMPKITNFPFCKSKYSFQLNFVQSVGLSN